MTKDEIFVRRELEKVYPQLVINCKKVCGEGFRHWGHDLLGMTIEMYLSKKIEDQLKPIHDGKLENFLTFIMNLQLKSNTSKFASLYRKNRSYREIFPDFKYNPLKTHVEKDDYEEAIECVMNELDKVEPEYKQAILGKFFNGEPFKQNLSRGTETSSYIPRLNQIKEQIQKKCEHCL